MLFSIKISLLIYKDSLLSFILSKINKEWNGNFSKKIGLLISKIGLPIL